MADKILQELGFDVSDALANLSSYEAKLNSVIQTNARLAQSFNRLNQVQSPLANIPKGAQQANRALANIGSTAQRTGSLVGDSSNQLQQAGQTLDKFGRTSTNAGQQVAKLTIDFETFVRIISTQVIVRALNRIELLFNQSFRSAIEFGTGLAEIQTIARGSLGDYDRLSASITRLANAFNTDIQAVREGVYQTLSNQVVDAADSFDFLETALELSTATVTDSEQSVNALASVMNAFNLEADRADQVASALFKTVELGRLRLDDIADTLGRVTATGAQLGVTFEEILASISTLTVQGVRPAEAFTQLSGIFNALLKPSERLSEVLQSLGFDSGESALQTLGFADTLQALSESVGGSADEVARLFPNIRGLRGQFILTADGAQRLNENLAEFQRLSGDEAQEAAGLVLATDAQQAELALQSLQNFFTTEFGPALVEGFNEITESLGGVEKVIETLKNFAPTLKLSIPALFLFASKMAVARSATASTTSALLSQNAALVAQVRLLRAAGVANVRTALNQQAIATGLGQLATATVLVGVGESVGNTIGQAIGRRLTADVAEIAKETADQLEEFKKQAQERLTISERFTEQRKRSALQAVRTIGQAHQDEIQTLQTSVETASESFNSLVNNSLQFNENLVKGVRQLQERSLQEIVDSQERQLDLRDRLEERSFRSRLDRIDEERQSVFLLGEARDRIAEAQRALPQTQDEQSLSRTLALFEKGVQLADEAARSGTPQQRRAAEFEIEQALRRQLQVEQQLQKVREGRAADARTQAEAEEQNLERLRVLAKTITQNTSQFNAQGDLLNETELNERSRKRQQAVQEFIEKSLTSESIDQASLVGILDLSERLSQQDLELRFRFAEESIQSETNRLEQAFANIAANAPDLAAILGDREIRSIEDLNQGVVDFAQRLNEQNAELTRLSELSERQRLGSDVLQKLQDRSDLNLDPLGDLFGSRNPQLQQQEQELEGVIARFGELAQRSDFSTQEVLALNNQFRDLREELGFVQRSILDTTFNPDAVTNLLLKMSEIKTELGEAEVPADSLTQSLTEGARALDIFTQNTKPLADNLERAANAAERLNTAPTRSFGGRFFAAGGLNRGIDTLPAMLSPGEFVVNRDASQKFFSDLQRINAGLTPQFRNAGGDVSQVGDINISVHESSSPRETAREVMSQINRQLRRRVATLN